MKCIALKPLKLFEVRFFFTVYILQFVQADLLQTAFTPQQSKINNSYSYLWAFSRVHFKHQRQIRMHSILFTSVWLPFHSWGSSRVPVRNLRENNWQYICLSSMRVCSTICSFQNTLVSFKFHSIVSLWSCLSFHFSVLWLAMTTFCTGIHWIP